jgi:peptide/nickel transport system ATP-binding protein
MVTLGTVVGAVAGYFGGAVDSVAMRVVDVFLAFPTLILALAIAGTLGAGYRSVIIAIVATGWPTYARLVRGGVLAEREREYVDAARGVGARPRRILLRHILPNAASPVIVLLSFDLGTIVLFVASLGYLGVGIPPPTPEWGTMVADGKNFIFTAPQTVIFPGLAVALTVIGFNLLGDGIRNALDPRQESPARVRARRRGDLLQSARAALQAPVARRRPASALPPSTPSTPSGPLLEVEQLRVRIEQRRATVEAVKDVSVTVRSGETVGLVGESGCGKTMTALSVLGLLPPGGVIAGGRVRLSGRDVTTASEAMLRRLRGRQVGMVFQDPMTSLNPTMTIGEQIASPMRFHLGLSRAQARARAAEMLTLVGMPHPAERLGEYPHQLSGGQRQRVMIAMALGCEPRLLIADEPTTALDVSIQDQILALLDDLKSRLGMGLLLITHDMGVIARMADQVLVMYAGRIVESAPTATLFEQTRHPYTEALLESIPRLDQARDRELYSIPGRPPELGKLGGGCPFAPRCRHATDRCRTEDPPLAPGEDDHLYACFHPVGLSSPASSRPLPIEAAAAVGVPTSETAVRGASTAAAGGSSPPGAPFLEVDHVVKEFGLGHGGGPGRRSIKAVSDVSFTVAQGETFGLVGESGCGKTTIGRLITALERPDRGSVRIAGQDLGQLRGAELREARRHFQLVFQDPFGSLDPRMRVGATLREPMMVHGIGTAAEQQARVAEVLTEVGLDPGAVHQYPHEFSGGQRQRIGFARVLTLNPSLVVADEPVSSLDVSIRSQILNLMRRLQDDRGLTYVLISHDLSVVRYLATRVGVMYLGKLVEVGPSEEVYDHPWHPYTAGLLAAIPTPDPARERTRHRAAVAGELPSAVDPPSGCRFRTRCPRAQAVCAEEEPPLRPLRAVDGGDPHGHRVACHFPLDEPLDRAIETTGAAHLVEPRH